ncbi:MAG: hypothetical protein AAGG48_18630 [Planctomycetota bacterium]
MDQVKAQLAVVMKYGFWISSVIVLIGSVAIWYLTTGTLTEESDSQASKIRAAANQVNTTRSELPDQPNALSHGEMEKLIAGRRDEVLESWESLYERQQDILKWPVDVLTADLISKYVDEDGKLIMPIENHINFPTEDKDELVTSLRSQYATYIKNVLPDIAKIGGTEWTADFEAASSGLGEVSGIGMGMMGGGGSSARSNSDSEVDITGNSGGPVVTWSSDSQQAVLKDLFPWRPALPSSLEVYYSQENLWILSQLMQIVSDVNGDVSQSYQAKIREITQISIGKSVDFAAGSVSTPGALASGMMGGMGGMGDRGGMDLMGMDASGMDMDDMEATMTGGVSGSGTRPDPADNRYLNAAREPITGATLRGALDKGNKDPSNAPVAVAKRVPVKMAVVMDQRSVPEFVAQCGSADLMVEVNQVRVLPKDAGGGGGGMGMMGGMMGGMEEEGMGMMGGMSAGGGRGGGGGGGGFGGLGSATEPIDDFPLDMYVEIYGIIYIYNPPDGEKLGLEEVTEETIVDGATETVGGTPVAPVTTST